MKNIAIMFLGLVCPLINLTAGIPKRSCEKKQPNANTGRNEVINLIPECAGTLDCGSGDSFSLTAISSDYTDYSGEVLPMEDLDLVQVDESSIF